LLAAFVVGAEVRANHLPALAPVGRPVDVLAADIDGVVIVGRDRERHRPVEAVLQLGRGPTPCGLGPHLHATALPRPRVVADHDAADRAGSRSARPDDVAVGGVGRSPAALAAAHAVPQAARDPKRGAEPDAALAAAAVTRPAIGRPVLLVAEDVV